MIFCLANDGRCTTELRDKGDQSQCDGSVSVLDTGSCVCKSDTLVDESLQVSLRSGVCSLLEEANHGSGLKPQSSAQEKKIVDPSYYPLIFGKTRTLAGEEQVELTDVLSSYGKATELSTYDNEHATTEGNA